MDHNVRRLNAGKASYASERRKETLAKTSFSQVLTLPPEILSYIFELGTVLPESREGGDDSSSFPHFAVLCSHVCQHFRQVALSTPQLWTYIDFREGYPYETAHIFLLRSKDVPLTLDVDLTTGSGTQDDVYIIQDMKNESAKIFSMIVAHIHRWKEFTLSADYYEIILYWLLELAKQESAPCLERFSIFCHEDWQNPEEFQPPELRTALSVFTGGTPRIRSVELWGVHFDWNAITFLRGLRTLRLAWHARDVGLTAVQFMQALKQCPDLRELSLQQSGPLKGIWPKDDVTLKRLEVLDLAYLDSDIVIDILKHVKFPALKALSLDLEQATVEPIVTSFVTYKQQFSSVQSLKLRSFECSISKAKTFLQTFPDLTSIDLNFNYLADSFLKALTFSRPSLCPKVNTLKLSGLEFHDLKKMLQSRPPKSIAKLYLDDTDIWEKTEIKWLEKVVQAVHFYTCSDDEEATTEEEEEYGEGEHYHSEEHYGYGAEQYDPHYQMYGDNGHMYDL